MGKRTITAVCQGDSSGAVSTSATFTVTSSPMTAGAANRQHARPAELDALADELPLKLA